MADRPTSTLDELIKRGRSNIVAVIRNADISPGSDYGLLGSMLGYMGKGLQGQIESALRNMLPSRASAMDLREHADHYGSDVEATKASGWVICRGTAAASIVASVSGSDQLVHGDGRRYNVLATTALIDSSSDTGYAGEWCTVNALRLSNGPADAGYYFAPNAVASYVDPTSLETMYLGVWGVSSDGQNVLAPGVPFSSAPVVGAEFTGLWGVIVEVEATEAGERYNLGADDILTYADGAPSNVTDEVVSMWVDGGTDAPSEGALRNTLIDSLSERGQGALWSDIASLVENHPHNAVGKAFCLTNLSSATSRPGTVSVVRLGGPDYHDSQFTIANGPTDSEIFGSLPDGHGVDSSVASSRAGLVALNVAIRVSREYAPPWAPNRFSLDAGSTVSRIELIEDPTGIIEVGDYILVAGDQAVVLAEGPDYTLAQRRVSAVGASYVDLDSPIAAAGGGLSYIGPGSAVGDQIIEVIRRYLWTQAPRPYDSGSTGNADIGPLPAEWHVGMYSSELAGLLVALDGVLEASVDWGGADSVPGPTTWAQLTQIGLITLTIQAGGEQ